MPTNPAQPDPLSPEFLRKYPHFPAWVFRGIERALKDDAGNLSPARLTEIITSLLWTMHPAHGRGEVCGYCGAVLTRHVNQDSAHDAECPLGPLFDAAGEPAVVAPSQCPYSAPNVSVAVYYSEPVGMKGVSVVQQPD